MALAKSSSRFGKKPAAVAAPQKGAAKKPQTANKGKSAKPAGSKSSKSKKSSKSSAKYASLKAKQITVDRLKRTVWASAQKITEAIISAASSGNLAAAKELFALAGLYDIPLPDDENAAAAALPVPAPGTEEAAAQPAQVHPIDLFFDKIGVPPSTAEPEVA
jgi:hypothetical protein